MTRRTLLIGTVVILVILAGGAFFAFQSGLIPAQATAPTAASVQIAEAGGDNPSLLAAPISALNGKVEVDGRVVPIQNADLSLPVSGVVAETPFPEGSQVAAGEVILRLQADRQIAAVAQAEAQLSQAQARLAEIAAGPREPELAAAQAQLTAAQARLLRLQSASPEEILASRAAWAIALANLQKVKEGNSQQQIIAAEADLANAEALRRQAQSAYDQVRDRKDIGARPESLQLQQATNGYNAAQARLEDLRQGASSADLDGASAQVQQAQARLGALEMGLPADIAVAEADVRQSRAQFALLMAGARDETVAVAAAQVALAQAGLDQALAALAETELRAPFAGAIAALDVAVGEQVGPGAPVVRLADLSAWQIETEDLTELYITQIGADAPATLSYDAIPGLSQPARVTRIRPIGQDRRGDIVYTVILRPESQDARLLWNMTAVVSIQVDGAR